MCSFLLLCITPIWVFAADYLIPLCVRASSLFPKFCNYKECYHTYFHIIINRRLPWVKFLGQNVNICNMVNYTYLMLLKCCIQYASKFGKLSSVHRTGKGQFSFPKDNAKGCSKYHTVVLISHASKEMLKILQARLQLYVNQELPNVLDGFRKGRGARDQIAICWIIKKAREFHKDVYSASLTMLKPLIVWIKTNCGKFFKRWKYQTALPASCEACIKSGSNN